MVRGQNTILTLPHDAAAIRHILGLVLDRLDADAEPAVQAVVLAADVETVMAIGRTAAALDRPAHATVLAVPSAQRGARALRTAPPSVVICTPDDLLALVRGSVAKLHAVRVVVFAWADDLLDSHEESLATLVAELPKEAARILVTNRLAHKVFLFGSPTDIERAAQQEVCPMHGVCGSVSAFRIACARALCSRRGDLHPRRCRVGTRL